MQEPLSNCYICGERGDFKCSLCGQYTCSKHWYYSNDFQCMKCQALSKSAKCSNCSKDVSRKLSYCPQSGYLYVFINPMMEGLVKIGKTTRDTQSRAKELSAATGVPTSFIVAYEAYFQDCSKAEEYVHTFLESKGYRVSSNKEFFKAPLKDIIDAILEAQKFLASENNEVFYNNYNSYGDDTYLDVSFANELWQDLLDQADAFYHGFGDVLEDHSEALRLYEQAAKLGSSFAYLQAGLMYKEGEGCEKDINKTIEYLKEGAKRGECLCYAELAEIYMENNHIENDSKCWRSFFNSENLNEVGFQKIKHALNYLKFYKENNLPIENKDILLNIKRELLSAANDELMSSDCMRFILEVNDL